MGEKLTTELDTQFNQFTASSSKNKHEDKMAFNLNLNDDSLCGMTDFSKTITQSNSRCVDSKIKEDEETSDTEIEVLLLDMDDQEGVGYNNDDDEYDLTEEQENYLLDEDCSEHYIKIPDICSQNNDYIVDGDDQLFLLGVTNPVNQNRMKDQQFENYAFSSNSNDDAMEYENLDKSEESENVDDLSIKSSDQIKLKDLQCNSVVKSNISSHLNDAIVKKENNANSDNENITKWNTISDEDDEDILYIDENDYDSSNISSTKSACDSSAFYGPSTDPIEVSIVQNPWLPEENTPTNSSFSNNDEIDCKKKIVNTGTKKREFTLSKVMCLDSARRVYLNLLKDRTQSLLTFYSKYKNEFLQDPSKMLEELELDKPFKFEENLSEMLSHHSEREKTRLQDENINISTFNVQPLNIFVEKANDGEPTQLLTAQDENPTEKVMCPIVPLANTREEDLRHSQNKKIQNKLSPQYVSNPGDKSKKDAAFESPIEEKKAHRIGGLDYFPAEGNKSHEITGRSTSKNSSNSETFGMEQQQDNQVDDLFNLRNCEMANQSLLNEKDSINADGPSWNTISRTFPGSKFTEILNSSLYMEYEDMDIQAPSKGSDKVHCSSCKRNILDADKINVPHFESKFHKVTPLRTEKLKTNIKTQTLLDLFSLNNKIVKNILLVLLSEQFKTGASLTDIMKYLREKMALKTESKLKKDISNFLKAAVDTGIIKRKNRRYVLTRENRLSDRRKTTKIYCKDKRKDTPNTLRSLRPKASKNEQK